MIYIEVLILLLISVLLSPDGRRKRGSFVHRPFVLSSLISCGSWVSEGLKQAA